MGLKAIAQTIGVPGGTDVAVADGGTGASTAIAAAKNLAVPYILGKSAIPFISLSSGSVSAPGAITAITALPLVYAKAYCYFPANALATSIAAGWHYCTFSTTTAGTAFLDTYTSGAPTIPSSPVAVTDGKGAFTGDTGEEFGPTITVAAGALGANGFLRIQNDSNAANTANVKNVRVRYSGTAGTIFSAGVITSTLGARANVVIANRGATNVQEGSSMGLGFNAGAGSNVTAPIQGAIDTTIATTVVISLQRATATENVVLENYVIELLSDGT